MAGVRVAWRSPRWPTSRPRAPGSGSRRRSRSACCTRCTPTRAARPRPSSSPPGVRDRDRAVRQAHRQAGPVRRGVRRDLRHALRPRRPGRVDPIRLPADLHRAFQDELMLFYTGITRSADTILKEQSDNVADRLAQLDLLRDAGRGGGRRPAARGHAAVGPSARPGLGGQAPAGQRGHQRAARRGRRRRARPGPPARRWPAPAAAASSWSAAGRAATRRAPAIPSSRSSRSRSTRTAPGSSSTCTATSGPERWSADHERAVPVLVRGCLPLVEGEELCLPPEQPVRVAPTR